MKNVHEPIIIRSLNGAEIGFLEYSGEHRPTWSHPRAEMYLLFYNLRLPNREITRGRFFSDRHVATQNGDFLALEEYDTDGTVPSFDRVDVRLIVISTARGEEAVASVQQHGSIRPVRFENEKVIYEKRRLDGSGIIYPFEKAFKKLSWKPIQFGSAA